MSETDEETVNDEHTVKTGNQWFSIGSCDHGKTGVLDLVRSIGGERQASVMERDGWNYTAYWGD